MKKYGIDDILDGEYEFQSVREVLFDNIKNILKLCNLDYVFDEEVLNRAGIEIKSQISSGINIVYLSPYDININDKVNEFVKHINNKHYLYSLSEEDEFGYSLKCFK